MSIARRSLLRIMGQMPAAIPFARSSMVGVLEKAEPLLAAAGLASLSPGVSSASSAQPLTRGEQVLGKFLYGQVTDLHRQHENEKSVRYGLREAGIDYDIAALKSTSRSYKCLRQIERDTGDRTLMARVEKLMWG